MPSSSPSRSPTSMPGARRARLARRLAGGMTPAEVAASEGVGEDEILALLEDEAFAQLVEGCRNEQNLPEDEREALLIEAALAQLRRLADEGDVKVQQFLAYEDEHGRHPATRLRRRSSSVAEVSEETREVAGTPVSRPCVVFPIAPVADKNLSEPAAFGDTPERAAWLRRWTLSRQAPLGESGAEAVPPGERGPEMRRAA